MADNKRPWFPMYPADYIKKTRQLSLEEHGLYMLLLLHYWENGGPISDDPKVLCKEIGQSFRKTSRILSQLIPNYLTPLSGKLHNSRMDEEIKKTKKISEKRQKAAESRWKEDNASASDENMQLHTHPHPHPHKDLSKSKLLLVDPWENDEEKQQEIPGIEVPRNPEKQAKPRNGKPWKQAEEILEWMNGKFGKSWKCRNGHGKPTANLSLICDRLHDGNTPEQLRAVVAIKARKWQDNDRMREFIRPSTLFRKSNFDDYVGEVGNA